MLTKRSILFKSNYLHWTLVYVYLTFVFLQLWYPLVILHFIKDNSLLSYVLRLCPVLNPPAYYRPTVLPAKFDLDRFNVSPQRGEIPQNRPVSKRNTGRAALRADPAGNEWNRLRIIRRKSHQSFFHLVVMSSKFNMQRVMWTNGLCAIIKHLMVEDKDKDV